jgi:NAD-dependent SIR2 family protein deacetylase
MKLSHQELIGRAADAIAGAKALLINAGAGMGVDSGLPDFRGAEGFWKAYPAYRQLGLDFGRLANAHQFKVDPVLAWGFYGHRLNLYRQARPHLGFAILKRWGERMVKSYRVFTSNVDGQFQRAGFDQSLVTEVHGSIHHLQCTRDCGIGIFSAENVSIDVDETTMRCRGELPRCPACGALARPNVLMFLDPGWDRRRSSAQENGLAMWQKKNRGEPLVIVEVGAGLAIPTVRYISEDAVLEYGGRLVRINPRDFAVPAGHIGLRMTALAGLQRLDDLISR